MTILSIALIVYAAYRVISAIAENPSIILNPADMLSAIADRVKTLVIAVIRVSVNYGFMFALISLTGFNILMIGVMFGLWLIARQNNTTIPEYLIGTIRTIYALVTNR